MADSEESHLHHRPSNVNAAAFNTIEARNSGGDSDGLEFMDSEPYQSDRTFKKQSAKKIFISYSNNAGFQEKKFVCDTVKQLKENDLAEDIWFDKDETASSGCLWFVQRLEALDRCSAVILFLSKSFFQSQIAQLESKIILDRLRSPSRPIKIFPVMFNTVEIPKSFEPLLDGALDLSGAQVATSSLSEKSSIVVGSFNEEIQKYCAASTSMGSFSAASVSKTRGEFKDKRLCAWSVEDTQEWLVHLGIKEFYRQAFEELMIDGFLLPCLNEEDLEHSLGIDSRGTRRKILHQIKAIQDREKVLPENWHLQAKSTRPRTDTAYIIYDPADTHLARALRTELQKKDLRVLQNEKLSHTKEEYLKACASHLTSAKKVLVLLTDTAPGSSVIYLQVLLSEWLGKQFLIAVYKNSWERLRPSLKLVLGEKSAIDFERQLFKEATSILHEQLRTRKTITGVVLEQSYVDRLAEGVKPLQSLTSKSSDCTQWSTENEETVPKVFISYQWDAQTKIQQIKSFLEAHGLSCWVDLCVRGHSSMSCRSTSVLPDVSTETLQSKIIRNMKAAAVVICCFTPKYIQSDNCNKDLQLAMSLEKPLLPVLLHYLPWPPAGVSVNIRRYLCQFATTDLSNDRLFNRDLHILLSRIQKLLQL
ncbi:uncharacterized protein LOC127528469 [Erpetoichthys calabaricus]|uniref:uncharacterized protein LOC127528469 n=1 Tax=Erpetoichthys calabaricus TaxID=27687 RepID=UPI002234C47E|nr:uncharacterized protein LOC127528469 [Erpetoichthys calabaricus]